MRSNHIVAAFAIVSVFCMGKICRATLDQSFTGTALLSGYVEAGLADVAQTFTPKLSGALIAVDVDVIQRTGTGDLLLSIQTVVAGIPTGTVLASENVPITSLPASAGTLTNVPLSSPPKLVAGQVYAIVMTTTSAGDRAEAKGRCDPSSDPYATGNGLVRSAYYSWVWSNKFEPQLCDWYFQTYVKPNPVPTVSEWGIASLGLLLLAGLTIKFRGALPKRV